VRQLFENVYHGCLNLSISIPIATSTTYLITMGNHEPIDVAVINADCFMFVCYRRLKLCIVGIVVTKNSIWETISFTGLIADIVTCRIQTDDAVVNRCCCWASNRKSSAKRFIARWYRLLRYVIPYAQLYAFHLIMVVCQWLERVEQCNFKR